MLGTTYYDPSFIGPLPPDSGYAYPPDFIGPLPSNSAYVVPGPTGSIPTSATPTYMPNPAPQPTPGLNLNAFIQKNGTMILLAAGGLFLFAMISGGRRR